MTVTGPENPVNGTITLTYKWARRIAISLIGGTVLLVGIAMLVLPGPAVVVIPLGLGILGLEFAWARRWLRRAKERAQQLMPGRPASAQGLPSEEPVRTTHHSSGTPSQQPCGIPPQQPSEISPRQSPRRTP